MKCPVCESENVQKNGNYKGYQRYWCLNCGKRFNGELYMKENQYIIHFKTRLKKSERNLITREHYCIPTNECSYKVKRNIQIAKRYFEQNGCFPKTIPSSYCNIPNDIFVDEEHYTDEIVAKHTADCMANYDLNMQYFQSLDYDDFNTSLRKTIKKFKLKEIDDLKAVDGVEGLYILVLDHYKQVYIGQSENIKRRILSHWSRAKEFDHLLCGSVNTSILSIDSFGALDTTRIFYKPASWTSVHELEREVVYHLDKRYRLNRVAGGLNDVDFYDVRNKLLTLSIQNREM